MRGRGARSEKNKARTVQVGREKDAAARRGGRSGEGRGPRTTRRSSPKRQAKNASAPGRLATIRGRISARGRRRARARAPRRIGAGSTWQTDRIVQPLGRRARTWSLESRRRARSRCARARRTREKFGASAREVGSGARGGRSRTRGAECEEAPRGKVKKCRPAGRYFPQAGKENSSRVGRNAGSRLVARVRLIRGARTDGRGQVNPPGTRDGQVGYRTFVRTRGSRSITRRHSTPRRAGLSLARRRFDDARRASTLARPPLAIDQLRASDSRGGFRPVRLSRRARADTDPIDRWAPRGVASHRCRVVLSPPSLTAPFPLIRPPRSLAAFPTGRATWRTRATRTYSGASPATWRGTRCWTDT